MKIEDYEAIYDAETHLAGSSIDGSAHRVAVHCGNAPRVSSGLSVSEQDKVMTVDAGNGLSVRIFQHPSDELTEL